MNWKYTDSTNKVVYRTLKSGGMESCLVEAIADWLADGNTPEPADVPIPPQPLDQIRAIESTAAVSDAMQRAARLVALSYALDELIRIAASKGQTVTRTQAHDWSMVNDSNYKTLYDAEQAIKPLRALV